MTAVQWVCFAVIVGIPAAHVATVMIRWNQQFHIPSVVVVSAICAQISAAIVWAVTA